MRKGVPALTFILGGMLAEAAAVCLAEQGHRETCTLSLRQETQQNDFTLHRLSVSEAMRRAYRDLQEATEFGACGVALLLARAATGYTAVERSVKGTGFDYWLGAANSPDSAAEPLERKARLEVSGILRGSEETIAARATEKIQQTRRSEGDFPAYAIVVEFSRPMAWMAREEREAE